LHKAIIAKIDTLTAIAGAEKIQIATVLGEDVIVSKDAQVGDVGVFFPVDLQLSEQYCYENSLFRDKEKNKDKNKAGFFDTNRRVRAQPFMKVKSCGYFADLESLRYVPGSHTYGLGHSFDEINGVKVCEKYISVQARAQMAAGTKKAKKSKEVPFFEKHVDSEQFAHYADKIPEGALISIAAKVHGTSFRVAKTQVIRTIPKWKQLVNKVVPLFPTEQMEYVVGTRNVVLETPEKEGFHGSEGFRFEVAETLKPYLEDGMSIYGEIAGFVNGSTVMPPHDVSALKDKRYTAKYGKQTKYTYGCKDHEYRFHIYRITRQTLSGDLVDMPQKQLEKWCESRGLLGPVEVYPQFIYDGNVEKLKALVSQLTERPELLTEDYIDPSHISEGVILRCDIDGDTPKFFKSKSFAFKVMEGILEIPDMETTS
jgi:hypothetical protein